LKKKHTSSNRGQSEITTTSTWHLDADIKFHKNENSVSTLKIQAVPYVEMSAVSSKASQSPLS